MIKMIGINNQEQFENNGYRFTLSTLKNNPLIIGGYHIYDSALDNVTYAIQKNDNEYFIIQHFPESNNDILGELAVWIKDTF